MKTFLKEIVEGKKFELLIDKQIFSKDVVLRAAYNFLERGYFFFEIDNDGNTLVQFSPKPNVNEAPEDILWEFSDELLSVYLRQQLERENQVIRESIIWVALTSSVDRKNFIEIDSEKIDNTKGDFDKDIHDILKEIENDPDLKINEQEIEEILKEIEQESKQDKKQEISVNPAAISEIKAKFSNKTSS